MKSSKFITVVLCICALLSSVAAVMAVSNSIAIHKKSNIVVDVEPSGKYSSDGKNTVAKNHTPAPEKTPAPTETPEPTPTKDVSANSPVRTLDPSKPIVALSFDDGPGTSKATGRILDTLEKYHINATFFVVGDMAQYHKDSLARAVELGCEIGNHTQTHQTNFKTASTEKIQKELDSVDKLVEEATGKRTYLVRPPWGSYSENAKTTIDHPFILWSVDTEDWKSRDKDEVFKVVKRDVYDGCIILMHDIYESTADAVELVVPWLIDNGYQVCSVSDMFAARGVSLEPGHVYGKAPTAEAYTSSQAAGN